MSQAGLIQTRAVMNKFYMSPHWTLGITAALLVLTASTPLMASDNLAVQTLVEQARFWEGKGRTDLAAAAWKRLLQIQPQNPDALAALAQTQLETNGAVAGAATIESPPKDTSLNRDAVARESGPATAPRNATNPLLDKARESSKAGRLDEAVGFYKQLFGDRKPTGALAVEFYQTLGGTANGWEEALSGLDALRKASPANHAIALAYAQHLTYRPSSRREGIRLLQDLSRKREVARGATAAWRQALVWLDAAPSDRALFQAYLKAQPEDETVRAKLAALSPTAVKTAPVVAAPRRDTLGDALAAAFKELNGGDLGMAEQRFQSILTANPKNADALGGLGVVRLKQERFADAESLLASAVQIAKHKKWTDALNTSRFWLAMKEGQAQLDSKQVDAAKEAFKRASSLDPKSAAPDLALTRGLMQLGQIEEAQTLLAGIQQGAERQEVARQLAKLKAAAAIEAKEYDIAQQLLTNLPQPLAVDEQELLAWALYHKGEFAAAEKAFVQAYKLSPSKASATGVVFSHHKQKKFKELLDLVQADTGFLTALVAPAVRLKISQGETRFDVDGQGRLLEIDPVIALTEDVLWPATLALLREKNPQKAYDLLAPVENKLAEIGDFGMMVVLGEAATQLGHKDVALRTLRKAAEETDDDVYHFTWAQSLIRFGQDQDAESIMLKRLDGLDADGLVLLGWTQSRLGKPDQAVERFAAAYAKEPSEDTAQALVYSAAQSKKYSVLLTALGKRPGGALDQLVGPEVRKKIADGDTNFAVLAGARLALLASGGPSGESPEGFVLRMEPHWRGKSGNSGEGKLHQKGVVASLGWQGQTQNVSLEWEKQNATDQTDSAKGHRWYAKWGMKLTPSLNLDVGLGRTLSGGMVQQETVGELGLGYHLPGMGGSIKVFRRGNEESLLALTGTLDLATGVRWGRVLERGVAFSAYSKGSQWDVLGSLLLSRLEGQGVAGNGKVEIYGRALHPVEALPGLSWGPELYVSRFHRNLSAFEPGHGGYFSPSRSLTFGALGRYETRFGDMSLTLTGGLGWGYNREDAAAGNPITGVRLGQYPQATGRGLAYHGRVEGQQPLGDKWSVGFGLGAQKSSYYSDWRADLYAQRKWSR